MLITTSRIKGNSGILDGSPVFSNAGLMHNTMFMAFNKESKPRPSAGEEKEFCYTQWKQEIAEM